MYPHAADSGRHLVLEQGVCRPGWVQTSGDRIVGCGAGVPPSPDVDLPDATIVPGFVDIHAHGGGGASLHQRRCRRDSATAGFHREHGTTTTLASLVTASPADLLRRFGGSPIAREGIVAGIHLEGPWLSAAHCGAHDNTQLRDPTSTEIDGLLAAGDGAIRMVTPHPSAPAATTRSPGWLTRSGCGPWAYRCQLRADPPRHRAGRDGRHPSVQRDAVNASPRTGPALALLQDPRVTVELIADGVHVHPAMVNTTIEAAGADRVALVTDATAAAGVGDGEFRPGPVGVDVVERGGPRARHLGRRGQHRHDGSALRHVAGHGADRDTALTAAVRMTSTTPARTLGIDAPEVCASAGANLVALESDYRVGAVMARGSWVAGQ